MQVTYERFVFVLNLYIISNIHTYIRRKFVIVSTVMITMRGQRYQNKIVRFYECFNYCTKNVFLHVNEYNLTRLSSFVSSLLYHFASHASSP